MDFNGNIEFGVILFPFKKESIKLYFYQQPEGKFMEILENLYEFEIKKLDFLERKMVLEVENINLYGPPGSGKSYLVWNYLSFLTPESYLYIDFSDLRIEKEVILEKLSLFLHENPIHTLVIDNWGGERLPEFSGQTIAVSRRPYPESRLTPRYLSTLDFEEYLLFDHHQSSQITHIFNSFLKNGTIPAIVRSQPDLRPLATQEMLKQMYDAPQKREIFLFALRHTGLAFSLHQIFQRLKTAMKLSKDKFYLYVEELEAEGAVDFIPKYQQPHAAKKIYTYDFALRSGVTFEKNFSNVYENMILLELRKLYPDIYYHGMIDFYIPEESLGVIAMPFTSHDGVENMMARLGNSIPLKRLEVITMGHEEQFEYNGTLIEIQPFWQWALKDEK